MSSKIKEIEDKNIWDKFITPQNVYTFVQSWEWGELNKSMGDRIWRFGLYKNEELIAVALVIKVHARRGNFLFVPHGPIISSKFKVQNSKYEILKNFTDEFKNLAKKERVNFIRVSPLLLDTEENKEYFKKLGFRPAPIYMHAETTWTLIIGESGRPILDYNLIMGMRKNTRNLIRRAEKEGVEIISGTSSELINEFLKLYKKTSKKHNFVPFSDEYIYEEIKNFNGNARIYLAKWQNKILSSAVIVFYGHSAFYHHGANSLENNKIPAAYLLQWQVIKDAKEDGKKYYNFWGIAKDELNKKPRIQIKNLLRGKHPWHGLTFFKKGFGGYKTDYMHAQDLPLNYKYWKSYLIEKIRLWRRGV